MIKWILKMCKDELIEFIVEEAKEAVKKTDNKIDDKMVVILEKILKEVFGKK